MDYTYQNSKMCFVIIIQHNSLFFGQEIPLLSPFFAYFQTIKNAEFHMTYTSLMGKAKNEFNRYILTNIFRLIQLIPNTPVILTYKVKLNKSKDIKEIYID